MANGDGHGRRALVTGAAGFIGLHLCERLLADGFAVTGLDAMADAPDPRLQEARAARLLAHPAFGLVRGRVEEPGLVRDCLARTGPGTALVHLAAQAGVRRSIDAPRPYVASNLLGAFEVLEAARAHPPAHLLLASTSSVYGANERMPYAETDRTDAPLSFYAATKKAGEAMAHAYAHLYGLPVTAFRFFTVYGPWGRPDMALFGFTKAVLEGRPIDLFNGGDMRRDFTYVGDLVEAIRRLIDAPPARGAPLGPEDSLSPAAPFRVVNIGGGEPVRLLDFVAAIEAATGRPALRRLRPMQPGDVPATWADGTLLRRLTGFEPRTRVPEGVRAFVDWYRGFYGA